MEETHPFTIEVSVDPLNATRFRWAIREGVQVHLRSPHSYEFRDDADKDAKEALTRASQRHLAK
jgi:hypothetical protein